MIVDPPSAGLAIKQHPAAKHHAEPSGQRRYPARVCRSLKSSEARNKTAIAGRVERCPVEVPFGAENNVAELVVDPELAAANESTAVGTGAKAKQAVVHASSCPGTSEVAANVEAGPVSDRGRRIGWPSEVGGQSRTTKQCSQGC